MLSELAAGTDTISKSTTGIAREFLEVDRLAGSFADQAFALNNGMNENRKRADRGLVAVREAVEQVLNFARLLKTAANQVNSFRMWSSQIGETAGFIAGLAEQTNILAMNAQNEAARAGAAGTGFKVVAIKISEMAENTTKFAERIAQVNHDLQQQLEQVSSTVNTTDRKMAESTSLMEEAGRLFTQIADNIRRWLPSLLLYQQQRRI
jgi:methyl-accepting chemotaxis protein